MPPLLFLRLERRPQNQSSIAARRRTAAPPIAMPAIAPMDRPRDVVDATGAAVVDASAVLEVGVIVGVSVTVADIFEGLSVYVDVDVGRPSAGHESPLSVSLAPHLTRYCLPGCNTY